MKSELAETILKSVMNWADPGTISNELQEIQVISEIKYDDYQQYTHGMRYIENLALWLREFDNPNEREVAYKFIKENLIFISEEEMRQIISVAFEIDMKPKLLDLTKEICCLNNIIDISERKRIWKYIRRTTLFLGLSDGSHIDYFRRQNADLSNEQVFVHYDFSEEKSIDMLSELNNDDDATYVQNKYFSGRKISFRNIFLLDDFTASGKSYIRYDGKWRGKIVKFFDRLNKVNYNSEETQIHIVLYVATGKAISYIRDQIDKYKIECNINGIITINAIQFIDPLILEETSEMYHIIKKDYEKHESKKHRSFVDKHYMKGNCINPFLGFDGCKLALVLYHNTPNNSLPIIWHSWDEGHALFPRITRHKEN